MPGTRNARFPPRKGRTVFVCAVLGAIVATTMGLVHAQQVGIGWVALIQPGVEGGLVETLEQDFPGIEIPTGRGHDGQYFYAIARNPTDVDALTDDLGRSRYRLQRPLFSALAWALHPTGGGYGLVFSMAALGAASLALLGYAAGALSVRLGGPPLIAAVVPLLPGPIWSFRLGLADNLALALALLFVLSSIEDHRYRAVAFAVLAVLTKEAMLVIVVAHAMFRRRRWAAIAAATATAVAAAWWLVLRLTIESDGRQVKEITAPLGGIIGNLELWTGGEHLLSATMLVLSMALAGFILVRRGPKHPLYAPVLASAAFVSILGIDVLGLDHNGTRAVTPTLVLALITAVTPDAMDDGPDLRAAFQKLMPNWSGRPDEERSRSAVTGG